MTLHKIVSNTIIVVSIFVSGTQACDHSASCARHAHGNGAASAASTPSLATGTNRLPLASSLTTRPVTFSDGPIWLTNTWTGYVVNLTVVPLLIWTLKQGATYLRKNRNHHHPSEPKPNIIDATDTVLKQGESTIETLKAKLAVTPQNTPEYAALTSTLTSYQTDQTTLLDLQRKKLLALVSSPIPHHHTNGHGHCNHAHA